MPPREVLVGASFERTARGRELRLTPQAAGAYEAWVLHCLAERDTHNLSGIARDQVVRAIFHVPSDLPPFQSALLVQLVEDLLVKEMYVRQFESVEDVCVRWSEGRSLQVTIVACLAPNEDGREADQENTKQEDRYLI
ncbi:MAG: hypothetical protein ACM31O_03525 [Bacteroidota bacterium]